MGNYGKYAHSINETAMEAFEKYQAAVERQREAEAQRNRYPVKNGAVSADYAFSSAKAAAEYAEANLNLENTRRAMVEGEYRQRIRTTRKELASEIMADYTADPDRIDGKALELLKSGIMKSTDYSAMLRKAIASENHTMTRLVTKYAGDAAEERGKNPMTAGDAETAALRRVQIDGQQHDGGAYLEAFDFLVSVYDRCIDNPAMIPSWVDLTYNTVKAFGD